MKGLAPITVPKGKTFSNWLKSMPGIKESIDLEKLANRSVGIYCSEDQPASVAGMAIPDRPFGFSDVGPGWLAENPSQFARDGNMSPELKLEITNYLDGNASAGTPSSK